MPLNLLLRALPDLGYISAKHIYETGDIRQNPANLAPIGTGPFKFVKYERGQYIIADRNDNYWRPNAPYLDRIVWRVITDRAAAAAQMEAGELHLQPVLGPDDLRHGAARQGQALRRLDQGQRGQRPHQHASSSTSAARSCPTSASAAPSRMRINVPFFIENFLGDFAKLGTGPIPSTSTDFYPGPNTPQYPYDKAKAIALLDEAGFKPGAGGTRFSLRLLPAPWGEDISLWATFIQQSLGEVGIQVEIVRNDGGGFLKQVYDEHAFDLATGWHQYRNDPGGLDHGVVSLRPAQGRALDQPVGLGRRDDRQDHRRRRDRGRSGQAQGALCRLRHGRANTELPVWMPIEQIFVTVITGEGAQPLQHAALGLVDLARSLASA